MLARGAPMVYIKHIAAKRSDRVSGSAVTTEFLKAEHTDFNKQST